MTGKCPLSCRHCYADSGPSGTHGSMTRSDWHRVLGEAVELRVEMVQFIGGEPTLYPDLVPLIEYALARGLAVEVFSNLVHVTNEMWDVFSRPRVSLATSYYSDDPAQHAAVTGRPSYTRTKANIAEAVRRGIPLRAGVIDLGDGQRADAAQAELVELGVPSVGYDRVRQVGRGVRDRQASTEQLCGQCGDDVAAISPDGAVWPCVFSRWLPVGNVLDDTLAAILASDEAERVRAELAEAFAERAVTGNKRKGGGGNPGPCQPDCNPNPCQPSCAPRCSPSCSPCAPSRRCWPSYK
ncbi:radical SAM protein [Amycolatopsis sp. CA-230715]|uniref:radical SAM protein n=1 Tax=Amycolatopsis sp. CA-230715 TaxID=2745196 RepID=UPI0020B350CB|nr:radical SAM protein [Amycolatopsis sp. CA-230715]